MESGVFGELKLIKSAILSDLEFRDSDRISVDSGSFRMSKQNCESLRNRIRSWNEDLRSKVAKVVILRGKFDFGQHLRFRGSDENSESTVGFGRRF